MRTQVQEGQKEAKPIILTMILPIAALMVLLIFRQFPNVNFWISMSLYLLIDIGFLIAMLLGIRTKKMPIIIFSVLANGAFFVMLSAFIYLLLLGHGISEP
ncbi:MULTISPECIES: hypothetical protein [unclassified Planococcus (in: firmicutes)]|uniref:hypothetical protein n=1 Tax=unclassified Planococcus (in: firmicutes) TaxID=2662419 RepID=UPI000C3382E1|nr:MULTISPECIES: hypothetical protein [unclassified Planococcus (in: firmicutes)]AUD12493.1 hypothetical protein CW734_01085 [Planococcus sp. MB-3u-03]PKG48708.1 hypothetical protein CXF66_00255 [Planococcus sp. Urea-trap-24]PKG90852.1 hypothetical protein CXF91_03530 [Planococcus sp. Urea-3u-39]PKH38128.1 hypothetical protein CXF77_12645 [Planococcus sp. MB-3u-09]